MRGRLIIAVLLSLGVGACSTGHTSTPATVSNVVQRLGCDRTTAAPYRSSMFQDLETTAAVDCYRDGSFVGRVHRWRSATAAHQGEQVLNTGRYPVPSDL